MNNVILALIVLGVTFLVFGGIGLGIWLVLKWINKIKAEALGSEKCIVFIEIGETEEHAEGKVIGYVPGKGMVYGYYWRNTYNETIVPEDYAWRWYQGKRKIRLAAPGDGIAAPLCQADAKCQVNGGLFRDVFRARLANAMLNSFMSAMDWTKMLLIAGGIILLIVVGIIVWRSAGPKTAPLTPAPNQPAATDKPNNNGVQILK